MSGQSNKACEEHSKARLNLREHGSKAKEICIGISSRVTLINQRYLLMFQVGPQDLYLRNGGLGWFAIHI